MVACQLDAAAGRLLTELAATFAMTARGIHRTLRVARTIADLTGRERVGVDAVSAAMALRDDGMERLAAA
jgi:magnesium chelatase family protein